jgi:hypothetical protein
MFDGWTPYDFAALGQIVAGAAALGTVAVAVAAARYGKREVDETRAARREQSQPYVLFDIQPSPASRQILDVVIDNTGTTIGREIRFHADPPLPTVDGYSLADSVLMTEGLPMLAPRQRMHFFFADGPELFKANVPLRYDVTVEFTDLHGVRHTMKHTIDLSVFKELWYVKVRGIHDLAGSTKDLTDIMKRIARDVQELARHAEAGRIRPDSGNGEDRRRPVDQPEPG